MHAGTLTRPSPRGLALAEESSSSQTIPVFEEKLLSQLFRLTAFVLALFAAPATGQSLSPKEARAVTKEAVIYGFPRFASICPVCH